MRLIASSLRVTPIGIICKSHFILEPTCKTPNEKWLTDITKFQILAGKVYLSPIIDCFDGMVISWSIGTQPGAGLVNTMLDAAIDTVTDAEGGTIVHSDRGTHYSWPGWLTRISDAKLVRSMSRKGCSQDNAACEAFFCRLKNGTLLPSRLEEHHNRAVCPRG